MTGNIVGEPFDTFVREQIKVRQSNQYGGYDSSRTGDQLQYLTNRNAWVKLASSVNITDTVKITPQEIVTRTGETITVGVGSGVFNPLGQIITNPLAGLQIPKTTITTVKSDALRKMGIDGKYAGSRLAEAAVLFNTLSSFNPDTKSYLPFRAGISNNTDLWNDSFAYGIGGSNYGLQPPPGIIGATVDSLNRGSIRKANVTLKAHNKFQFDIIELLYLRLGFTMMLEWGWDRYLNSKTGKLEPVNNTIIEEKWFTSTGINQLQMLSYIQGKREEYNGNYDGFFGKVSNFTWNFNPDGTYDISIDLITLGDVIESLKVNTSVIEKFYPDGGIADIDFNKDITDSTGKLTKPKLFGSNISKIATLNTLGYFLYNKIKYISNDWQYKDYRTDIDYIAIPTKNSTHSNPQYYIRLYELLTQIENRIIPKIQNGNDEQSTSPQIQFEKNDCFTTYFPNQISFDPRVCIFKPSLNSYGDIDGVTLPFYLNQSYMAPYIDEDGNGILMNLYINFDFVAGLLISTSTNEDISLFTFLQNLCNGINDALGSVNKLEPIIKDDYKVTIIDQTFSSSDEDTAPLEIYGYSPDKKTSNFVKDIKFVSKITPQLASMISIGATAAGSSTSQIDGTAFSKWSEGLVDRFALKTIEPKGIDLEEIQQNQQDQLEKTVDEYKKIFNEFDDAEIDVKIKRKRGQSEFGALWDLLKAYYGSGGIKETRPKIVRGNPFYGDLGVIDFDTFFIRASQIDKEKRLRGIFSVNEINELTSTNYGIYLIRAFGGISDIFKVEYENFANTPGFVNQGGFGVGNTKTSLGTTTIKDFQVNFTDSRYLEFDDVFISQGKSAYKSYINTINNNKYDLYKTPSSEVGFIPLSFDVLLDGISGIKIYNKLDINNDFLPSNYPSSLKFVITKVNHNILNNNWETSLSTISIPRTKPYKYQETPQLTGGSSGNSSGEDSSLPGVVDGIPKVTLGPGGYSVETTNLASKWKNKVIYVPEETKKTMLVLHHTAGNPAGEEWVIRDVTLGTWKKVDFPLATHYVIQDGITEQIFDEKYWSYHCGYNDKVNKCSLSVELGAYGCLILRDGKYWAEANTNFMQKTIPENQVARTVDKCGNPKPYRGYEYMQKYTPYQITKLENLIIGWRTKHKGVKWEFNYDEMFPGMGLPNQDKGEFRILSENAKAAIPGVYSHNSTEKYKIDVMPQLELIQMLRRVLDHATPGMDKCPRNSPSIEDK